VPCRFSHILNVRRSNTFLASGNSPSGGSSCPVNKALEVPYPNLSTKGWGRFEESAKNLEASNAPCFQKF